MLKTKKFPFDKLNWPKFKYLGQAVLDLVFPITCLICGTPHTFLCVKCQGQLTRLTQQRCLACQQPSAFGKTHPSCVSKNTVDGAIAGLNYKDKHVEKIIETFKYNFISDLAQPLAELIIEAINRQELFDYFESFILVPVPLHPRRFNWRGFNQAELLAMALGEKLQISLASKLVNRSKFTKPQIKLTAEERRKNLDQAFAINPDASVGARKILIVDDVVTTGATMNELAKILKRAGAAEVWALSAAHG